MKRPIGRGTAPVRGLDNHVYLTTYQMGRAGSENLAIARFGRLRFSQWLGQIHFVNSMIWGPKMWEQAAVVPVAAVAQFFTSFPWAKGSWSVKDAGAQYGRKNIYQTSREKLRCNPKLDLLFGRVLFISKISCYMFVCLGGCMFVHLRCGGVQYHNQCIWGWLLGFA